MASPGEVVREEMRLSMLALLTQQPHPVAVILRGELANLFLEKV